MNTITFCYSQWIVNFDFVKNSNSLFLISKTRSIKNYFVCQNYLMYIRSTVSALHDNLSLCHCDSCLLFLLLLIWKFQSIKLENMRQILKKRSDLRIFSEYRSHLYNWEAGWRHVSCARVFGLSHSSAPSKFIE